MILIPGEVVRLVFEHVDRTGRPLLRERRPGDGQVIRAWHRSPEYDLTLGEGAMDVIPASPPLGEVVLRGDVVSLVGR